MLNDVLKQVVHTIQHKNDAAYFLSVIGYWIEGIPYSSSGLTIDASGVLNSCVTEHGFEAEMFWEPRYLDPATTEKKGTVSMQLKGNAVEVVQVRVRVYYCDILGITYWGPEAEEMLFQDARVIDRKADFVKMQMVFNDQRTQANKLPDELEFYKRWRATEGDGLMN